MRVYPQFAFLRENLFCTYRVDSFLILYTINFPLNSGINLYSYSIYRQGKVCVIYAAYSTPNRRWGLL